jgi:hypothetical protein
VKGCGWNFREYHQWPSRHVIYASFDAICRLCDQYLAIEIVDGSHYVPADSPEVGRPHAMVYEFDLSTSLQASSVPAAPPIAIDEQTGRPLLPSQTPFPYLSPAWNNPLRGEWATPLKQRI